MAESILEIHLVQKLLKPQIGSDRIPKGLEYPSLLPVVGGLPVIITAGIQA